MICPFMANFVVVFVMALFVTLNVNGLRDPAKRLSFCHWLSGFNFDIVCLQELHCISEDEVKSWFPSFSVVVSVGSNKSCGVAVLFKPTFSRIDSVSDSSGRFVRVRLLRAGATFDVVSLYAPNLRSDCLLFFPSLLPFLDPGVPTLLCGDFNSVMDPCRDRRSAGGQSMTDTSDLLVSLFRDLSCVDVWRSCHPSQQAFTWLRPDGTRASRIDLVGCPVSWLPSVSSCDICACLVSDHSAVVLSLASLPNAVPHGPGFWKLNTSVLTESDYIGEISSFWSAWQNSKGSFSSLLDWWDLGKARIKSLSISYWQRHSARKKARFKLLSEKVANLRSLVDQGMSLLFLITRMLSLNFRGFLLMRLVVHRSALVLGGLRRVRHQPLTFSALRSVRLRVLSLPSRSVIALFHLRKIFPLRRLTCVKAI